MANKRQILPYFLAIIIDTFGFGLIAPILAPLVTHGDGFFPATYSAQTRHLVFGLIIALSSLCFMFGAPLIGRLSDYYGRKRVLQWCVAGGFIGFICYIVSFSVMSIAWLVAGRVIMGFLSGSQSIAQAAMADNSRGKEKVINISLIALALTIGLVLGPLMGGVLSDSSLVSWFTIRTPFYAAAILVIINFIVITYFLEKQPPVINEKFKGLGQEFKKLALIFNQSTLLVLVFLFFLFEMGWSLYFQSLALFLSEKFHLGGRGIGLFSSYVGLCLSVALMLIVRYVVRYVPRVKIIQQGLLLGGASLMIAFFADALWEQLLLAIPVSIAVALVYSSLIAKISDQVDSQVQGFVLGVCDAVLALAFATTGFLAGWLTIYNSSFPLLVAALLFFTASVVAFCLFFRPRDLKCS